jgi:hypothetical protein
MQMVKNIVTVQSQSRKHYVFPRCGVSAKKIYLIKSMLLNASIQRISLTNLLGSEQLQNIKYPEVL